MTSKEEDFARQLRATFKVEAGEHVQSIVNGLLALEKAPMLAEERELMASVFRAAHSLKGAARAVDLSDVESACQNLEDLFASWKRPGAAPVAADVEQAHAALDEIIAVLKGDEREARAIGGGAPNRKKFQLESPVAPSQTSLGPALVRPPHSTQTPALAEQLKTGDPKTFAGSDTVRISIAKLDTRLLEAEELLTAKTLTGQRAHDLQNLGGNFEIWRKQWSSVEPEARELRRALAGTAPEETDFCSRLGLKKVLEFCEWNCDQLKLFEGNLARLTRSARQDRHIIGKLVDDLLEDSKKLLLLPFGTLSAPLPKLVRDMCRDLGKEAHLEVHGEGVEIDKRILEEMKDPLIHLLRNSVDHGVELPDARRRTGKPLQATLTLAVSRVNGSKVEILLSDDGAGIDVGKVKESAVSHGRITAEAARQMSDAEACDLIFLSEVSASPIITRLSGRGLGMAIVRERAEKLGGTVAVESDAGAGSRVRIVLPAMLSTFRGVLIRAAGRQFVVPTAQVDRVARVKTAEVQTVEGRETIALGGRAVALVRMSDVLGVQGAADSVNPVTLFPVIILGLGEHRIAFAIDAVLNEQEVLVKPLRRPLSRVRHIAGATVLGSGQVAPILNVPDLLKTARKFGGPPAHSAMPASPLATSAKCVLVVDDSATSRMLIKSMMESAGYKVATAVDGMEAFTRLRAEKFDVLVSDVEMPRLNGFDLTARIRGDKKLAELPVVLVTARETREDRERGIDVGANAYIVKSSLDDSNLLEAVLRLL